jgi:magnesium-transporting ATPase (P-type)
LFIWYNFFKIFIRQKQIYLKYLFLVLLFTHLKTCLRSTTFRSFLSSLRNGNFLLFILWTILCQKTFNYLPILQRIYFDHNHNSYYIEPEYTKLVYMKVCAICRLCLGTGAKASCLDSSNRLQVQMILL